MLVLSRKECEQICIGDDIIITIVRVGGGRVKIGVDAPKDVPVFREELTQAFIHGLTPGEAVADDTDEPNGESPYEQAAGAGGVDYAKSQRSTNPYQGLLGLPLESFALQRK